MSPATVPAAEVLDYIARAQASRDCTYGVVCEIVGDLVGVRGNTIEKWLRYGNRTGTITVELADAIVTALDGTPADIPSLDTTVPPTADGYCPACREQVICDQGSGRCVWCDTPTLAPLQAAA